MFYEYGVNSCTRAISCSTMVWVLINNIGCFLLKPVSVVLWYRWRLLCWCRYYSLECFINCHKLFALKGLKLRSLKKNVTSFIIWSCKTLVWRWHWKWERRAQWRRHRYDVAPCVFFYFLPLFGVKLSVVIGRFFEASGDTNSGIDGGVTLGGGKKFEVEEVVDLEESAGDVSFGSECLVIFVFCRCSFLDVG